MSSLAWIRSNIAIICCIALLVSILPVDVPLIAPVEITHAAIDDPSDVSSLVLWLDADDTSTLFTDSSCTTGASSGNTIACWQDKSGSGSHVTQISGDCAEEEAGTQTCNLPTYTIDQFNARDALVFDRTNKDALRHTLSSTWNGNYTVFIAFEQVGTPAEFYSFFSNGTPAGNTHFQIDNDASGNFRWNATDTKLTIEAYSNTLKLYTIRGDSSNTTTYADGQQQSTSATTPGRTFEHYRINQNRNGNHLNNAKIAEVIVYQRDLTDCELENVSIYLGDKYGRDFFGIGDNYGFSAPYDNDVNGIGAPSSSCSPANTITSAQSDILTVSNPSTMTTNDFLTFGHNGSGTVLSTNVPSGYTQRIQQIWRMDEDGDANGVGTVTVSFDLSGTNIGTGNVLNFALLTDSNDDFSDATVITSGRSFDGNTLSFTGVDFSNGDYVSLAIKNDDVPGSVGTGLLLWLDASDPDDDGDSGNNPSDGGTVSVWHDRSGNNNDATIVSGETAATYQSDAGNLINSHPVLYFDRTGQSDGSVYETTDVDIRAGTNEDITIFTVYRPNEDSLGGSNHHGLWGADNGSWDRFFATNHASFGDGTNDGLASLGPVSQGVVVEDAGEVDTVRIMAAVYDGEVSGGVNSGPANGSTIYFNGNVVTRFTDETDDLAAQDHLYIGWDGDDGAYDGDIAEMIVYNRILSCTEFNNVTAYLGNKYGQSFNTISPGGVSCSIGTWLKADAGVTQSSGKVSTWADQTGNDYDATQGTNNNRPNYISSAINFNPALEFKGDSEGDSLRDYLDFSSSDAAAMHGTENSYFFVYSPASTSHLHHLYYIGDGTGNTYNGGGDGADQLEEHFGVEDSGGFKPRYFAQDGTSSEDLINIYANDAVSANEVVLMSVIRPDTTGELFVNGVSQGTDTVNGDAKAATNTRIGGHQASINYERFFEGNLAELVVYTAEVTANDRQKIESYLAMKYGLTLSGGTLNYLSSSGATVWDADANNSYGNDITALGREDLSSLSQYKSKSEHSDSIVTMSGSTSNFADHEFMLWGNDDGSLNTWLATDVPGGYGRVTREWKIQEIGDVGTVTISVDDSDLPASTENVWLLTDTDGVFANATLNSMSESSGTWSTTFNPGSGSYFSFAIPMSSPGGISSGMTLWLKANDGVTGTTEVSNWADQSGNSHDYVQGTSSNRPALTSSAINFNPAITFDGSSDFLEDADGEDYLNGETTYSSFAVVDSDATNDGFIWFSSNESSNSEAPWGLRYDQSGFETGHSNIMKFGVGTTSDAHKLYEIDENNAVSTDPLLVDIQWTSGSTPEINLYNASKSVQVDDGSSTIGGSITGADYVRIGRQSEAGHSYWDGHIAELIFYEEDVTDTQESKIVSYLGIKYGLTLSSGTVNYVSASGSTIWSASDNSSYNNDIAGLGRDDTSALTQYKSKSVHSDAILTMSGTTAEFLDHEFIVWGNNNGLTSFTEFAPVGYANERLLRVWKAQETGDTGLVSVTFSGDIIKNGHHYFLLTDSDGNFGNGGTSEVGMGTATNDSVTFNNINISDGLYFTLGGLRQKNLFQFFFF